MKNLTMVLGFLLSHSLASAFTNEIPKISDMYQVKVLYHEGDDKQLVDALTMKFCDLPMQLLMDFLKEKDWSHGRLERIPATKQSLRLLEDGIGAYEVLEMALLHTFMPPNANFWSHKTYRKMPRLVSRGELIEEVRSLKERFKRRRNEIEETLRKRREDKIPAKKALIIQAEIEKISVRYTMLQGMRPIPNVAYHCVLRK